MAGKIAILFLQLLAVSVAAEGSSVSKRYLSVYANDVTSTTPGYSKLKDILRQYVVAWKNHNMKQLKAITSLELFQALNVPSDRYRSSITPPNLEIEDLAIYEYKKRIFAQFDVKDPVSKKTESLKSWFEVQQTNNRWIISAIHDHFDPDAGP